MKNKCECCEGIIRKQCEEKIIEIKSIKKLKIKDFNLSKKDSLFLIDILKGEEDVTEEVNK